MIPIPPQAMIFLAKYGLKILAVIAIIAAYYFWHHHVYQSGYKEAVGLYEARDAKDAIKAANILEAAKKSVADKAKENDNILIGVLTHNDEQIKNLISERDAALSRSLRVTTKTNANSRDSMPGKAGVLKGDDSGGEGSCDQELAGDNQQKLIRAEYEIARLADLHLSCIAQIERTHTLK